MRHAAALLAMCLAVVACGTGDVASPSPTDQPTLPPPPTAAVTPAPPATARPRPTPEPTEPPPLALELVRLTQRVRAGETARLRVQTEPGAECTITVTYESGPSDAKGLEPKTAGENGLVGWSWTVGRRTPSGTYPIDVACSQDGVQGELSTEFRIR